MFISWYAAEKMTDSYENKSDGYGSGASIRVKKICFLGVNNKTEFKDCWKQTQRG